MNLKWQKKIDKMIDGNNTSLQDTSSLESEKGDLVKESFELDERVIEPENFLPSPKSNRSSSKVLKSDEDPVTSFRM